MLEAVFLGFCYLFELFTCRIYIESFFFGKRSGKFKFFAYSAVFLLLYGISFLNIPGLNVVVFIVSYISLILICYESKLKSAFFNGTLLSALMFLSEVVVMHLSTAFLGTKFMDFRENLLIFTIQGALSKLLFFVVVFLVSKYFKKRDNQNSVDIYDGLLTVLPLTTFVILYFLTNFCVDYEVVPPYNIALAICSLLLLFANLSVFYIYEFLQKSHQRITQLSLEHQKTKLTGEYYELLSDSYGKQRILIHDIKRHLSYVENQIRSNCAQEAADYIAEIRSDFGLSSEAAIEMSGNKMVDAIITRYIGLCKEKNIAFETDIHPCNLSGISDSDWVALLDNMFENAIEAAEKTKKKTIRFSMIIRNSNYVVITLKNSCSTKPKVNNGNLITIKKDAERHGTGILSIKRIVQKHKGHFDWNYDETQKLFGVSAVLEIKNTD